MHRLPPPLAKNTIGCGDCGRGADGEGSDGDGGERARVDGTEVGETDRRGAGSSGWVAAAVQRKYTQGAGGQTSGAGRMVGGGTQAAGHVEAPAEGLEAQGGGATTKERTAERGDAKRGGAGADSECRDDTQGDGQEWRRGGSDARGWTAQSRDIRGERHAGARGSVGGRGRAEDGRRGRHAWQSREKRTRRKRRAWEKRAQWRRWCASGDGGSGGTGGLGPRGRGAPPSPPPTPTTHTTKHGRKSTGRGTQGTDDDIEVASAGYGDARRSERGEA